MEWIAWVPLLPAFSAALLFLYPLFSKRSWSERAVSSMACGVLLLGFSITVWSAVRLWSSATNTFLLTFGQWFSVGKFSVEFGFYIDALTLVMMLIVTGVGALIHWFSSEYMSGDDSYARFFAYLNLFIASMLVLVMADSFLLLYLGWEGVGLCSFLLIGFWYKDPNNGYAARKAFVVTRVGDTAMAIALLLLFIQLGTLNIQASMSSALQVWGQEHPWATLCALLLLGGAVGKSAQLPLQTWLPDAMAGPTPVSALIHAATMVTAGVYLIARTHVLFELSDIAMTSVATIGALTLFIAGCCALVQTDIKRILAYSTMSQIGYMFYALGVGAWSAGIFHLMTHAFFKALLFLAAGLLILSLHHQQNIFRMGGLRQYMPVAFWSFLVGSCCLAAVPMTSGYFSKEMILLTAFDRHGFNGLWLIAVSGAFLTSLYSFRLILVVFFGDPVEGYVATEKKSPALHWPLFLLVVLAVFGALLEPDLATVFSHEATVAGGAVAQHSMLVTVLLSVPTALGFVLAYLIWGNGKRPQVPPWLTGPHRCWLAGWGFDAFYNALLIKPLVRLSKLNRNDVVDSLYKGAANSCHFFHQQLSTGQNGQLRWYVAATTGGAAAVLLMMVLL